MPAANDSGQTRNHPPTRGRLGWDAVTSPRGQSIRHRVRAPRAVRSRRHRARRPRRFGRRDDDRAAPDVAARHPHRDQLVDVRRDLARRSPRADALAIATFPTVLLLTTLFRLALNVSSARLILLQANAGEVIRAFGNFVVRGNYIVGGIVFLILTIIQFVVIAKGGERVAEVSARFVLDAMPGKQMAIDAELRSGTIDGNEARRRRRTLSRESQFYGSMDGALKFINRNFRLCAQVSLNQRARWCAPLSLPSRPARAVVRTS